MLRAGPEAPAAPARAANRRAERAVELGENRPRHVHGDAADLVDQVAELSEVDDDHVVDRDVGVARDCANREPRPADLEGRVDLRRAVTGNLDTQVAWDREVVE